MREGAVGAFLFELIERLGRSMAHKWHECEKAMGFVSALRKTQFGVLRGIRMYRVTPDESCVLIR